MRSPQDDMHTASANPAPLALKVNRTLSAALRALRLVVPSCGQTPEARHWAGLAACCVKVFSNQGIYLAGCEYRAALTIGSVHREL